MAYKWWLLTTYESCHDPPSMVLTDLTCCPATPYSRQTGHIMPLHLEAWVNDHNTLESWKESPCFFVGKYNTTHSGVPIFYCQPAMFFLLIPELSVVGEMHPGDPMSWEGESIFPSQPAKVCVWVDDFPELTSSVGCIRPLGYIYIYISKNQEVVPRRDAFSDLLRSNFGEGKFESRHVKYRQYLCCNNSIYTSNSK